MSIDYLINTITTKRNTMNKNTSDIHSKQAKINSNNRNIMDYKKKITASKSMSTIKSYYSKIASLEKNNESLNKEISNIQKRNITLLKDITRYEKQLMHEQSVQLDNNVSNIIEEDFAEMEVEKIEFEQAVNLLCKELKKDGLNTKYGKITDIVNPGKQGGNGRVLFGVLNKQDVAIKILFNSNEEKNNRFFTEFINVFMSLQKHEGIVEMYLYDSINYKGHDINYIIMKKYSGNLESNKPDVNYENLIKIIFSLLRIIKVKKEKNIIHRDIKPANILIDDVGNLILSDFGIAHFDSEKYDYTGHTVSQQYLANRKFSAPEQSEPNAIPAPTMDIYAIGQILQWFVFGKVHTGNGRVELSTIIQDVKIKVIDKMIDKCIEFLPEKRYQSADEILNYLFENGIKEEESKEPEKIEFYDEPIYNDNPDCGEEITVI